MRLVYNMIRIIVVTIGIVPWLPRLKQSPEKASTTKPAKKPHP